jgi:hypothetical protein
LGQMRRREDIYRLRGKPLRKTAPEAAEAPAAETVK